MGKIESTFGSVEAGEQFRELACGRELARLGIHTFDRINAEPKYQVIIGRVGKVASLMEPSATNIPEACLQISPYAKFELKRGDDFAGDYIDNTAQLLGHTCLRIVNPLTEIIEAEKAAISLTQATSPNNMAFTVPNLTVDGTKLFTVIRDTLLDESKTNPKAKVLYAMLNMTLNKLWGPRS